MAVKKIYTIDCYRDIIYKKGWETRRMAVIDIKIDELDDILNKNEKVFVDVWATWCMPCKVMSPIFEDISDKYEGIQFARIESDEKNEVGEQLNILSIPAFLYFKNGELVNKKSGMMTVDELEEIITD